MPLFGPPNVEKMKLKGDVSGLLKATSYQKQAWVREHAAAALGKVAGPEALPVLLGLLEDPDPGVRGSLPWALADLASRFPARILQVAVAQAMIDAYDSGDEAVRVGIITLLPEVAERAQNAACTMGAADTVLREVEDVLSPLRDAALPGLLKLAPALKASRQEARAIAVLRPLLAPGSRWSARKVSRGLADLGAPPVEPLITLLDQKQYNSRLEAAEALRDLVESGKLDRVRKQRILAERGRMAERHVDIRGSHTDRQDPVRHGDRPAGHQDHTPAFDCIVHTDSENPYHRDTMVGGGHIDEERGHTDQGIGVELWV